MRPNVIDALDAPVDAIFSIVSETESNPFVSTDSLPEDASLAIAPAIHVESIVVVELADAPRQKSLWYERSKRMFDIAFALAGCVIFSPVLVLSALCIKLTDFGPILFRQVRVGRGGQEFICYKFRSMIEGADALKEQLWEQNDHKNSLTFKIRRDPRITRIGSFLRRTSIDELPQLWNVLVGDMSIVGPRPPVPSEVAEYSAFQLRRLEVKPGLTCIWQVSGRGDVAFDDQLLQDIEYIENRSLWLDLRLILKTVPAVLSTRGAY